MSSALSVGAVPLVPPVTRTCPVQIDRRGRLPAGHGERSSLLEGERARVEDLEGRGGREGLGIQAADEEDATVVEQDRRV